MHNIFQKSKKTGFTLIELMVVVAIISLLSSVVISKIASSRLKAQDANTATELHLIQVALEEYNTGHGGFPNPQGANQSSNNMYCIGSTGCVFNGIYVNTQLKGPDIAFNNKTNTNLLASSFPVYSADSLPKIDDNNMGFIYVACGGTNPTCANDQAILMYPKAVESSFSVINVGTFTDVGCTIAQCQENYGHNCGGSGTQDCSGFSSVSGACNYDVNGTGASSGSCTCGDGTQSCANYCGDSANNNGCSYDPNGTGSCNCNTLQYSESSYPYCTSNSNVSGYSYDSGNTGWCANIGYSYYGSGVPSNYPYYNGTGNCISVNVSSSYGDGQSGSYCDTPYDPGYTESSYPWFTSDSSAQYYGYTGYANGWSGYGYYGTTYPSGHPNQNGAGSCIYVSVSGSYGNGYPTAYYCDTQNWTYGCTNNTACNYNPSANYDDGSCDYTSCNTVTYGCTDSSACNYNPSANSNDGSCDYTSCHYGCTDSSACNYNSSAYYNDGSCNYSCNTVTYGCTDSSACNYNPSANSNDGSCDYTSCHSYSCQGTPYCDYYNSYDCSGTHSYCNWSSSTSNYCGGSTYSVYHDCSENSYYSCPSNGTCSPYDDGNGNQYCSGGTYYDYGNCSDLSYDSCNSYSGCYQSSMESGGTCTSNTSCSGLSQYDCGNISGCNWTY